MEKTLLTRVEDYWNTRAEGYSLDVQAELSGEDGKRWLTLAHEYLPKDVFPRGLDIGCGPGFFCALLGENGYRMTGIDCTEGMLRQAQENIKKFAPDAAPVPRLFQMDAESPAFEENSFDFIITRNLIWNLPHPEKAYESWVRLLRKGGRMLIMDGNYYLHYALPAYGTETPGASHKHMEGVDVSVINGIARELPLSFKLRPDWDIEALEKMGCGVKVLSRTLDTGTDGSEIVRKFVLMAEKL